jgi:Uma2 family endonuclease
METTKKFTSADLALLPDDDAMRYEIIEGDLYVSKQPSAEHQFICMQLGRYLQEWNDQSGAGVAFVAPGVVFADDDDVAPDVIWMSHIRMAGAIDKAGHFTRAPELVVEVLSPGTRNEYRDRQAKLKLYSRRGVSEYWIAEPLRRFVEVYRREGDALKLAVTLRTDDALESPLLPGFSCRVSKLFFSRPPS